MPRPDQRRLSADEFRNVIGSFASGVTVITALSEGTRFGSTASAVSSLSLEPPMLLVCMNRQSATARAVHASRRFAVNVLGEDDVELAVRFASKSPSKFDGVPVHEGTAGVPLLRAALATLECEVAEEVSGGTHFVFLAEVVHAAGKPGAPLAYFRGEFGRLELERDESTARAIRSRVLHRELPVGEALDVDRLAQEIAAPRGSVYHALAKLTAEGLVARGPDGTFVVPRLTLESVEGTVRARFAIATGVAALTVGRIAAERLAGLRGLLAATAPVDGEGRAVAPETWTRAHEAFFDGLVALSDSAPILDAFERVSGPAAIGLPDRDAREGRLDPRLVHPLHSAIVEGYEAGDLSRVIEALKALLALRLEVSRQVFAGRDEI